MCEFPCSGNSTLDHCGLTGGLPLHDTDLYRRIRVDRIQALHARQRMHDVVTAYAALQQEGVAVPDYILNEVAAAWLYLKQPEKAAALYRVVLATDRIDDQ